MTAKNERMKQHALILSLLPDLVLAVCRSGEMTYVSPACQWLLLHSPQEITGSNVFELVIHDCHALLGKMISDNLSRPVHAQTAAAAQEVVETDGSDDDADLSDKECTRDRPTCREKVANHQKTPSAAVPVTVIAREQYQRGASREGRTGSQPYFAGAEGAQADWPGQDDGVVRKPAERADRQARRRCRADPFGDDPYVCLLYTSPSPRDLSTSRMPSSA